MSGVWNNSARHAFVFVRVMLCEHTNFLPNRGINEMQAACLWSCCNFNTSVTDWQSSYSHLNNRCMRCRESVSVWGVYAWMTRESITHEHMTQAVISSHECCEWTLREIRETIKEWTNEWMKQMNEWIMNELFHMLAMTCVKVMCRCDWQTCIKLTCNIHQTDTQMHQTLTWISLSKKSENRSRRLVVPRKRNSKWLFGKQTILRKQWGVRPHGLRDSLVGLSQWEDIQRKN